VVLRHAAVKPIATSAIQANIAGQSVVHRAGGSLTSSGKRAAWCVAISIGVDRDVPVSGFGKRERAADFAADGRGRKNAFDREAVEMLRMNERASFPRADPGELDFAHARCGGRNDHRCARAHALAGPHDDAAVGE